MDLVLKGRFDMLCNSHFTDGKVSPRAILFNRKLAVMVANGRARGGDAREVAWQATGVVRHASWKHCVTGTVMSVGLGWVILDQNKVLIIFSEN